VGLYIHSHSWHSAYLVKHKDNFTFYLFIELYIMIVDWAADRLPKFYLQQGDKFSFSASCPDWQKALHTSLSSVFGGGGSLLEIKAAGATVDQSPQSNAEVNSAWSIILSAVHFVPS
jgi:hypothetical protein